MARSRTQPEVGSHFTKFQRLPVEAPNLQVKSMSNQIFAAETVKTKIRQYVVETMLEDDARGFGDETPLTSGGLLDSFSVVQLILFLEDEFKIKLPHDRMTTADFENVNLIAQVVLKVGKS